MKVLLRPGRDDERAQQRAQAASAHQRAHAEQGSALRSNSVAGDGKNRLAHDREDHPTGAGDAQSAFDEDGGKQASAAANVAHPLEHRGVPHKFPRADRWKRFHVRLGECHARDHEGRDQKRKHIEREDGLAAQQSRGRATQRRAQKQVQRPGCGAQRVGDDDLALRD